MAFDPALAASVDHDPRMCAKPKSAARALPVGRDRAPQRNPSNGG